MSTTSTEAVQATTRTGTFNKNHARRVRAGGNIPAVLYGAGEPSVPLTVDPKVITRILHSDSGHNTIFDLHMDGANVTKAMIVDWQYEPIKGRLLHIDLKRIAMNKTMRVSVPVLLQGVPVGVKTGGVLDHVLREVEVECLPADIPSHLDVDVAALEVGSSIHISDLQHSDKLKFTLPDSTLVAQVVATRAEPEAEATATAAEPEVTKGKGKPEAAAAPAAPAKGAAKK